ncbi:hypothetical protein FRC12_005280 [Ceratobasidium sp. 428]|nr:hypothetical protein FRC12_005280 [Ceratobasidium sp. 428]
MNTVRNSDYLRPLLAGLSLATIARLGYLWMLPKPLPGIPHDPMSGIMGNLPDLVRYMKDDEKNKLDYFHSMIDKHGPLSQILLGKACLVIVGDKEEVERLLLRTKSTEQSTWTRETFGTAIPRGQLALPANDMWKRHRQLAGPSMSRRYLQHMSVRASVAAGSLVRLWTRKVELVGEKVFSADNDLKLAVLDMMLSIIMGDSPASVDIAYSSLPTSPSSLSSDTNLVRIPQSEPPPLHKAMRAVMENIERMKFSGLPVYIAKIFAQTLAPSWRKSYGMISDFIDNKVLYARAQESEISKLKQGEGLATDADCVVDMIAQREAREGAERLPQEELREELMTYVLAGQDTTAVELAWLVKYLPRDIDLQRRLHEQICAALGPGSDEDGYLDFEILNDSGKVPLLEAVVAESLRCAQIASNVVRELLNDEVILGRHIPKGTQLLIPTGRLSAQESDWGPDAKTWRPSRWLRADGSFDSAAGPSYPFGMGQRACFGQRMAVLQLKAFVAALSRAFVFKPLPEDLDDMYVRLLITRQPKNCYISLEKWPKD